MKILFAGGGTLGPVTPLLAVYRRLRAMDASLEAHWAGTPQGPERDVVAKEGIPFSSIPVAKLPRYLTWKLLAFPFEYLQAKRAATELVDRIQPDLVVSIGGYMGVPLIKAAAKRGIPCAIHQLDAEPGLSNRLVARLCRSVTTSFPYSSSPFGSVPSEQAKTPCRFADVSFPSKEDAAASLGLRADLPTIFVTGGGTGALGLNKLVEKVKEDLSEDVQIIHLTGMGKKDALRSKGSYHVHEFFDEEKMLAALTLADVVISRAGLGALSELACLDKPTILVPMPDSHQERNTQALGDGTIIIAQNGPHAAERLTKMLIELLADASKRSFLGEKLGEMLPTDDGSELAERWIRIAKS